MSQITKLIGEPAAFEGLAEECCELGHAALKVARILRDENPTPIDLEKAMDNLTEEYTDVVFYANALEIQIDTDLIIDKYLRFVERFNKHGK